MASTRRTSAFFLIGIFLLFVDFGDAAPIFDFLYWFVPGPTIVVAETPYYYDDFVDDEYLYG